MKHSLTASAAPPEVIAPKLQSIRELTEWTPIPESTWRWFKHTGRGPRAYKIGRRVYFDEVEVIEWIRAQRERDDA